MTETGPTDSTVSFLVPSDSTGSVLPSSNFTGTPTEQILAYNAMFGATVDPPTVTVSDVLSDVSTYRYQETLDRAKFLPLLTPNVSDIRTKLTSWVAGGFCGSCDLFRIQITAPNICSDGESRSLFEYIEFVSGKTYNQHVDKVQSILPGFQVGYRCSRTEFIVCVYGIKESPS